MNMDASEDRPSPFTSRKFQSHGGCQPSRKRLSSSIGCLLVLTILSSTIDGVSSFSIRERNLHIRTEKASQVLATTLAAKTAVQEDAESKSIESLDGTSVTIGDKIGSGSYGTVHQLILDDSQNSVCIGKRPWKLEELKPKDELSQTTIQQQDEREKELLVSPKERAERCNYYWEVEDHCFRKLPLHPQLPPHLGVVQDDQHDWMAFGMVTNSIFGKDKPAPTLQDLMKLDDDDNSSQELVQIGKHIGCSSYAETLDTVLESLLTVLEHVHSNQVVHRDVKPSNLLVQMDLEAQKGKLVLMDFGSAADLETSVVTKDNGFWGKSQEVVCRGLENGNRVAVSPIYCAPEVFVDLKRDPTAFDIFSSGLLFCQLLFGYLDERTDAGFHQQLEEAQWDLNVWLSNELGSNLRPGGLDHSLEYLSERPGLWALLERMLRADPAQRPSATKALKGFQSIVESSKQNEGVDDYDEEAIEKRRDSDGPFFNMVLESMETCPIPTISRALHYVATFSRRESLGLVLSEYDEEDDESNSDPKWLEATKYAQIGEVFIKEIVPGGQADRLVGIFDVGDQLIGVGDFHLAGGGFEKAVEMLQDQPRNAKNVRLHFDRIPVRSNEAIPMVPTDEREVDLKDLGAWSSKGKRSAQEDAYVLHEIHDTSDNSVLLAGVMDGHGGAAASSLVADEIPSLVSKQVVINRKPVKQSLEEAWEEVCTMYQQECTDPETCRADYNPREGTLKANTSGKDLIPGTTITMMALDETTGKITFLNCGDSRSLVATSKGKVRFETADHTPETEEQRILEGIAAGLDYSPPKCKISKWTLSVGAYEYSVARSLEGPFATSKGIVSDPDITETVVESGEILLSASDGLWEVMGSEEVALDLYKMRAKRVSASDAARELCSMAVKKGSSDNVSVVVVYL